MPRYFFHLVHRRGWSRDDDGTELPDLRHAHVHAMRLLLHARTCFADVAVHSGWLIHITDDDHRPQLTVLFPAPLLKHIAAAPGAAMPGAAETSPPQTGETPGDRRSAQVIAI